MAKRVKVRLRSSGMRDLLTREPTREWLDGLGARVVAQAKAIGPRDSGAYVAGIRQTRDTTDRAVVRVGSTVEHAPNVEAGTGTMARALDAILGDIKDMVDYVRKDGTTIRVTRKQAANYSRNRRDRKS